jgi:hypothetical protein
VATILGDDSAGGDSFPNSGDRQIISLFPFVGNATALGIHVRMHADTVAGDNIKALVYLDEGGGLAAATLHFATSGKAAPAGGGIVSWSCNVPIGTADYYLGLVSDSFNSVVQCDVIDGLEHTPDGQSYTSPTDPWGANSTHVVTARVNVWLTDTDPFAPGGPIRGPMPMPRNRIVVM